MKSQVDVALLIGSIIIPSAALLGALIFAFTLLGPLTDIAKIAAVISHDTITLADIAYSVPGDVEIHYKPPSLCKFADLKNPKAGCTSSPVKCSSVTNEAECNSLYGCSWDGSSCVSECKSLSETDCSTVDICNWDPSINRCISAGYGYYENGGCTPSFDTNGNIETDCCKGINDKSICLGIKACSWQDPDISGLSCLNGAMNMSRFEIKLHKENTTLLNGFENFPQNTEVYFPAVISKEYYSGLFKVPYPGYADILDKGFTGNVKININKDKEYLSIRKVRDGIYDTIGERNYEIGPLEDIAFLVKDSMMNEANSTGHLFLPQFYFTNYSQAVICFNRVAQSPDNVVDTTKQINYTVYCFDFQSLNNTANNVDATIVVDNSFDTSISDYSLNRDYTVYVNLTCLCDSKDKGICTQTSGVTCGGGSTTNDKPYCCSGALSNVPKYYVRLSLEEQT